MSTAEDRAFDALNERDDHVDRTTREREFELVLPVRTNGAIRAESFFCGLRERVLRKLRLGVGPNFDVALFFHVEADLATEWIDGQGFCPSGNETRIEFMRVLDYTCVAIFAGRSIGELHSDDIEELLADYEVDDLDELLLSLDEVRDVEVWE